MESKKVTVTPEVALNLLNSVAEKYQGTRSDHRALEASIGLLRGIVAEWAAMKQKAEPQT